MSTRRALSFIVLIAICGTATDSFGFGFGRLFPRRHCRQQPACECPDECGPKEVRIYYTCNHKFSCTNSTGFVVRQGSAFDKPTAMANAKKNAEDAAKQMCGAGNYRDDGPYGQCSEIMVTVMLLTGDTSSQATTVARPRSRVLTKIYECTVTYYCCDGRFATASAIAIKPSDACKQADAIAKALLAEHEGCQIKCRRCSVRQICLNANSSAPVPTKSESDDVDHH